MENNSNELTPNEVVKKFEDKINEKTDGLVSKSEIELLKSELEAIKNIAEKDNTIELKEKFIELEATLKGLKENAKVNKTKVVTLTETLRAKGQEINDVIKTGKGKVSLNVKASINPSDIDQGSDYATFLPDTVEKPKRAPRISDLFKRTAVDSEYIKYREQDTVTRDGKVVRSCATSTSDTKLTWKNRTVQIAKIRDFVDVCIDMMDDYSFVSAQVEQLVRDSVKLKEDYEILLGTGEIKGIDDISSTFNASNTLAPFNSSFQSPTIAELTASMKAQIYVFGQENSWDADTIVMCYSDFVKFMHQKNSEGDYLLPNFVMQGSAVLNGMNVITSPIVAPNSLYVFDSTKGEILDRQGPTLEISYENSTNFEHEIVTLKVVERVQFHVANIHKDAFMKCEDIASALADLTAE